MKIKEGFILRKICGEYVVSGEGTANVNFSKLISLNATAAFLFEQFKDREFVAEDLAKALVGNYEVSLETALADSEKLLAKWQEAGMLE